MGNQQIYLIFGMKKGMWGPCLFWAMRESAVRVLVEQMLEQRPDSMVTVTQDYTYTLFCKLSEQRQLGQLKRSLFKGIMRDLIRDRYDLALRHDVPDSENKHQQAWKGLELVVAGALLA